MKVTIEYFGQLRQAAGTAAEQVEAGTGATAQDVLKRAADRHGDAFRLIALGDDGAIRSSLMVLVNEAPIVKSRPYELKDGDRIRLLAAIAGG